MEKVTQTQWDADAIDAMAPVVAASPWAGIDGIRDTLGNAHLWRLESGRVHLLIALRGVQCEHGRALDVVGLRSLGERMSAAETTAAIERIARTNYPAIDLLSLATRHRHLVRGAERTGWTASGTIMTKILGAH